MMLVLLVGSEIVSSIGQGLCVLIGISRDDTDKEIEFLFHAVCIK
jgi:D-tyrosyl-tRNA(Tyr) deacylase